ncbi:hypothetical protein [Streptomyces sp. NPDC088755]|uniref:hypothetical protein n=1 Tax=Streptomyces sp. NPDC088755 TaxID=3365888 RepID=UPI0037FED49F
MEDNLTGPVAPRPSSQQAGSDGSLEHGGALAAFVGQEFAVALRDGLRRARIPAGAGAGSVRRVPPPPAVRTVPLTPGESLLREHADAIVLRFANALPSVPALAGPARRGLRIALVGWARQLCLPARRSGPAGERATPGLPGAAPHQQTVAVSLLIEAASLTLPPGSPAVPEAIRTLARVVRLTSSGGAALAP